MSTSTDDDDDDEVNEIMDGAKDAAQQATTGRSKAATTEEHKTQRPWSRFKFGQRRQQQQQQEPQQQQHRVEEDDEDEERRDESAISRPEQSYHSGQSEAPRPGMLGHMEMPPRAESSLAQGHTAQNPALAPPASAETRVQVERDDPLPERIVREDPQDDEQVFVSRLFVDHFLIREFRFLQKYKYSRILNGHQL